MRTPTPTEPVMQLTKTLVLPADTAGRSIAILAQRGSGKTYTGMKMAELLHATGQQVVCLDPTGVWWGLRAAGDKHPGLDFIVMGGDHSDVPLEPTAGEIVAQFIVGSNRSVVLDMSAFTSKAAQTRFLTVLAEHLYRLKNSDRTPLHLMLDEADDYIPQRHGAGEHACVGAFEAIVRRGRSRGLGMTMITQRPACLNKSVLTQVDALLCMRTVGKNDVETIQQWVQYYGSEADAKSFITSLPMLADGEMWCWSPSWMRVFERGKVLPRVTRDTSSTPVAGKVATPVKVRQVDLSDLTEQIKQSVERIESNDPRLLRGRIADLEKAIADLRSRPVTGVLTAQDIEVAKQLTGLEMHRIIPVLQKLAQASSPETTIQITGEPLLPRAAVSRLNLPRETLRTPGTTVSLQTASANNQHDKDGTGYLPHIRKPKPADGSGLSDPQQRILNALKLWENSGDPNPTLNQVGMFALLDPSGGHFSNVIGPLSSGGLITRNNGRVSLTDAGRARALDTGRPSLSTYHDVLRNRLEKRASKRAVDMLNVIIDGGGRPISLDEIAERTGMNVHGGHFSNTIGPISSLGLVTRQNRQVTPTDLLFPTTIL